jgi:3-methyladenine DNA glycosylase AlkC
MPAPLKHGVGKPAVQRLAKSLTRAWPDFERKSFERRALRGLGELELKERVRHVADVMASALPKAYPDALDVILKATDDWEPGDPDDPLRGFAAWPLFDFIALHGLDDVERSLDALRRITAMFTAEFAMRPFIAQHPQTVFATLERWTEAPDEHVRRLVSECVRPRLPWGVRVRSLIDDPEPVLALLERLKDDPAEYVRRSVANNLNDVAKDHPDRVIDLCESWLEGAATEQLPNRRWIVERATRTLVKQGHPRVWGLLGFTKRPKVELDPIELSTTRLSMGDELRFSAAIVGTGRSKQRLAVDYAVHYVKANGAQRPKVFKLKVLELAPKQAVQLASKVSFRPISTRVYYPGEHAIAIHVNGIEHVRAIFTVD